MPSWKTTALLALLAAAACGDEDDEGNGGSSACTAETAATGSNVDLRGLSFQPGCLRVPVGTTVTYRNEDDTPHTVTADAGQPMSFDSNTIAAGGVYMQLFDVAGTIAVHCELHPEMRSTVIVTE